MNYRFEELVNVTKLSSLLQSHHGFSGMAYGLFDTNANILLTAGWQDICTRFHRVHPISCARCRENDASVRANQNGIKGEYLESPCKNGLIDVAMPVVVEGRHLATFLVGQFFYEDRLPEREFFVRQADECGFDQEQYLAALERVPVFSREHIRSNMQFLRNMVELLAETGFANLRLKQETEERKQAEEALLTRETELQQYTDFQNKLLTGLQNADVVFWLAEGGRITYCNDPRFGEPFGLSEADMAAHPLFINLVHPDDRPRIADIYQRRSAGEPMPTAFEVGVQWVNGERREVEVVVSVIGYNPLKTLIIYKDITGRKRMEQALAVQEAEFRTLAENLPDNIARYDREGRTVYINPALEKALGATTADVIGTRVREFHPDGSFEIYAQAIDTVLDSGKDIEIEFTVPVPSEEVTIHQIRIIAEHNEHGEVIGGLAIGRDITERKQYEMELLQRARLQEQLAAVAEAVPGFIYTVRFEASGYNATFPYASPGIVELLGVRPEEIRDNAAALRARYHPDDIPGLFERIAEARQTGAPFRYELRAMHPDKGLRWIEMRATVQLLPDGTAVAHGVMIDITERKQAEARLHEMQSRLTTIFATIPDMVWMKDKDGVYLACNSAFEQFSGVAEADLIGKTDYDLMDAEQADCCRKSDRDAILVGEVCFSEEEVTYAVDDRRGLLEVRKVPVYGAGGCLTGVLGIGRDITERKQTEDALQQQNIFQNSLFMGLQNADVNLLMAEGGRFTYCNNSRFGEPFGLSEADMAANPEFIRFVHPDDQARIAEIYQRRSAGEQMPTNLELSVQWANGERREVELVVSVMGYNPLKTLFIYKDITERKRMEQILFAREQEFHTLAENAPDPIFRYDRDCRRTYLNPAAQRLLQAPASELLGRAPLETPLRWPVTFYQEMISNVLKSGKETEFELTLKRTDQEQDAYMHVRLAPEYDASGQVYGVLAIGRDITERKRMEDELQRKNSELERFTYTVSHDLKSPVITIKSFSGCIKSDLKSNRHDRLEKDLDRICAAADKMTLLLDDLLKLSRSGRVIDTPVPMDMRQLVEEVLKGLEGVLQESGVQINVQPNLPTVQCDRQRMTEVLQNLIENAVKYRGDQPEPRIVIGLRQDGDQQVFFVQDNGPGIGPKYHDNIFGLFNRLSTSLPGTGIGLALVKRIIEVHGGRVWVESDGQGNGSTFCFTVG